MADRGGDGATPADEPEAGPRPLRRRVVDLLLTACLALVGATIGVLLFGSTRAEVGPFDATFAARPDLGGGTEVHIPPLGRISLDSHAGPLGLDLRVDELRPDEAEAIVRELVSHDLGDWHVDEQWFISVCLLAETCGLLGFAEPAADLYALIEPYAGHNAVAVPEMATDSAGRPLGVLAVLLGRYEDAERHFADAIAMNERMGALVWAERAREALAAARAAR